MRVLIGCEHTGIVRDAFIRRGHDAWSCDIKESLFSGPHFQRSILEVLDMNWDMAIFFPPCTFLCSSGMHWNDRGRGWENTRDAIEFARALWFCNKIPLIALENSKGILSTFLEQKPTQMIQPHEFGHDAAKTTCLWLRNLPPLKPTLKVSGRVVEYPPHSGKFKERWANQTDSGNNKESPGVSRSTIRSITYRGIANAMAEQWG